MIKGIPCSPGFSSGSPVLVRNAEDGRADHIWLLDGPLSAGLVVAAIGKALGIVARTGGFTSHGASLAREAGIPAVSGVENLLALAEFSTVSVDGTAGEIQGRRSE